MSYALRKLKAFLDFAAVIPEGSSQEIQAAVAKRFPTIVTAHTLIKRFDVYVRIREDGLTDGGYIVPERGRLPFALQNSQELDIFIQNLMRADIQQRIEVLR